MDSIIYFDPGEGCCKLSPSPAGTVLAETDTPFPEEQDDSDLVALERHLELQRSLDTPPE